MPQTLQLPKQGKAVQDSKREVAKASSGLEGEGLQDALSDPLEQAMPGSMVHEGEVPDYSGTPDELDKHKDVASWVDFATTGTLFVDEPSAGDVVQSHINDCWLVGTLSAAAGANPDFVKGMISEDAPGKYRVRLYEKDSEGAFKPKWIGVDAKLPAKDGMPYYAWSENKKDGKIELWPSIVEKAYAKFKGKYSDINWGNSVKAYEALFGTPGDKVDTKKTDTDVMWTKTKDALDANKPMVASTGKHVIAVLSYTEKDGNVKVKVRDQAKNSGLPGTSSGGTGGSGPKDRTEELSWEAFRSKFTYVRFSNVPETIKAPAIDAPSTGGTSGESVTPVQTTTTDSSDKELIKTIESKGSTSAMTTEPVSKDDQLMSVDDSSSSSTPEVEPLQSVSKSKEDTISKVVEPKVESPKLETTATSDTTPTVDSSPKKKKGIGAKISGFFKKLFK